MELCEFCGNPVVTMIFRGTGYCSVDCKKHRPHDTRNEEQNV